MSDPLNEARYLRPTNPFVPFAKTALEQSLSDRFEQQVELYPERIAVKGKGEAISYRSLNSTANRVARALLQACEEEQQPVGLLMENGAAVIAAIFGVLKSGKVYVPLDPSLPQARIEFILRDSQTELILTNSRNLSLARELRDKKTRFINVDELDSSLSIENVGLMIPPSALAYIIYTSGSTGQPKGVIETHRNLLHNVMRNTNVLHISSEDRVSLLRSIGAAGAARDALTALQNGATLCPFSIKEDGLETLGQWLIDEGITVFTSVITVFRHLIATLSGEEQFDKLRLIYAGGEQATKKDVELYQQHFSPECLFVNRLGVTETGTVTYYFIGKETQLAGGAVPVGYAAEDMEIMLLDDNGAAVGPDSVGEIAVKSRYLSPGYWRNPELTRSVFLPDAEGGETRIYRTGDLGRKLPDGCLVHLGWKDLQVNIRGHRIEVAEVEAALLNHPGVKEVAVVGREHWSGEIRLAAALVPVENATLCADELRKFLTDRLPDHMIPSVFMLLDALPLGPNGKVDRRALPSPDWLPAQIAASHVAARTELEEFIAGLWEETLSLDVVGIHDNFFDLGGHSLLLGQIVSKLQAAFKIDVALDNFFQQPTVAALAEMVRKAFGVKEGFDAPIASVSRPERLPLSFGQERLWFLHQLEPDTAAYNIPTATLIDGRLDVDALDKALNEVVKRHAALRTTFTVTNGQPAQVIIPELRLALPVVDLSNLSEAESESEARRLIVEYAQRSFDLSEAPLLRVVLLKLSRDKHVFVTVHHLVADAWSIGILFKELSIVYDTYVGVKSSPLAELPVQYTDFAIWQRQGLRGQALESLIAYWKQQLGDDLSAAELPTDRPRPNLQSFRGARQSVALSEILTAAIKDLSRENSTTLFMTLLAAFKTLLYRYTSHERIIIGSPIAGRTRAEVDNLIGLFVNTLVLRTDLSGNPCFRELLRRVREACLGAYAHQDLPFEKLVEELQPERDLSRNPLFQVMFVLQNTPVSVVNPTGLTAKRLEVDNGTAKFDLTLSLAEQDKKLIGFFEYSTDLFDHSTIERMIGHFQTLLKGIVANPGQPLSMLPLLTEAEQHQRVIEWNDTRADYPKGLCLHELFQVQVEQTPESTAVEFDGKRLTYRELNTRVNQLAHYLRKLGVGPEKMVGICVERSLEMVIGLLGILKAGGAYLPLDPAYPRERLEFMLNDARAAVLLTQERLTEDRRWRRDDGDYRSSILDPRLKVVCVDRDWKEIARESEESLASNATAENLAYVIYTSGSTGQPKGVQVSHRSVVNCLHAIGRQVELTDSDVFLAVTTISFDIAGLELYLPLITGAKLVLASRDDALDGKLLSDRLTECGATTMQATPSAWQVLLDAGWRGSVGFKILCGGEALSRKLANQLLEGDASLWNLYGPTETTVWSAIFNVERGAGSVPIGRPIANTQINILDSHLQPVPVGMHGELYIGGDGLARGYLKRPESTTEKFLSNPFNHEPGSRLYRTGDLARYLPDGNIEFLGRVDNQVKIRGYRIELGEIEAALNQHPAVLDNAVVARERGSWGDKSLVGYVVLRQQSATSVTDLRRFLEEKLPEYTIPAEFLMLDALPQTPNGKIDRNALPLPDGSRPLLTQGFMAPRTEIEELVVQVWREVLKVEEVGVYDNFFDLGGHSLLATRVVARLRNYFSIDLPLRKLFELPTVAALAEHIDGLRREERSLSTPPVVPILRDGPVPLSFSQQRLWFLHQLNPDLTAYNIPAVFHIKGPLSISALERALNEIVNRHEALRTRITECDGQPRQEIVSPMTLTLPVISLVHLSEEQAAAEVQRLSVGDARQPYDLQQAPLMRIRLLQLKNHDHVLIFNFHHIVCDGSSLKIFYEELAALYEAFLLGEPFPLAPLPVQYADYAIWQREWLQADVLEAQLDYWRRQLGGESVTVELPTDYQRTLAQTFHGARLSRTLSADLTKALKDLSRREGVTLFMTLLATFDILLSRHTGQEHIMVGSTIAGRNRPEIDGLIGFFINALGLRTDLSGNPSFLDSLKRVREVCLEAYTHQDLPFEKVVEEINPQRDLSRNPLFQVMFNMADISERVLKLADCEVMKLSHSTPSAKFDITLHAPETDGKIELVIVYNADLFNERRISALLEQLSYLLSQIVENPQRKIDQYSLISPSAQAVLPDPTESLDQTWEGAIHTLFSKQAEHEPNRLAVVDANEAWTYRELDGQSNQLANYLITAGIQPRDVVVIYAHRSCPLVLALLGTLKAGAVFVILDPDYPAARLVDYLRIAQPKGWLQMDAAGELAEELSRLLEGSQLCCRMNLASTKEEIGNFLRQCPDTKTDVMVDANDPAYVAFTSGSTGQPKGVLCKHGPITHFLPWQKEALDLRKTDRFCMLSGLAYSHLHRDVFTALYLGATLCIPDPMDARSPDCLSQWLRQNEISVLHLTPALGQLLFTAGDETLPLMRRVFFGGDVLTGNEVAKIRRFAPKARVGSFYGATETQRAVGYYEIPQDLRVVGATMPLGRGIKDVQLLLLNKSSQLAGVGELGEVYVRSPHLAQGYLGDEERTKELFVTNPFMNNPKDRLYKTGELGRYLPDGNVEWAGRNDRRVNIRGFRVELEEVEAVLKRHPSVKEVAVVLHDYEIPNQENPKSAIQNPKSDHRLVAYVETDGAQPLSTDELRCFLAARLPDYMVPSHLVLLDCLPLSPNGKVDYFRLPPPDQSLRPAGDKFEAPRTEVEQTLGKIFSEVLGLERMGLHDNFFHLGGHSLLAAQATARIRASLNVVLDVRMFFESPTIAGLARKVEALARPTLTEEGIDDGEREEIEL